MARSLADPLYERLLNDFPATQAYTQADWADDEMPAPVAHFLTQLLNHHSRREARRLRRARTEWVDYEHPEMEQAVRTFFKAVKSHTRVPADEWASALRRATRHATAHLVRPVHVLSDFVYAEQQEPLPISKILWRMNFFGPYAYLRKAVQAFADKHELDTLPPNRFDRFLHRVDERITSDYDADRWLQLLDPLFVIARRGTGREQVPPALLQAFFEEKGRLHIEEQLDRYAADGHDRVAPRTLHRLIEAAEEDAASDVPGTASDASSSQTTPSPQELASDQQETDDRVWGVDTDADPERTNRPEQTPQTDDSVPLWQRFQQGRSATSNNKNQTTASNTSNSRENDPNSAEDDDQQPLWARFQHERNERLSDAVADDNAATPDSSETEPSRSSEAPSSSAPSSSETSSPDPSSSSSESRSPFQATSDDATSQSSPSTGSAASDLETLERRALGTSNPPHRSVYVRQLFDGDRADYQRVLRRIAEADSWGEASQIIASDVFREHKVNIYGDAAVHFTNTVEDRFRNQ